MMARGAGARPGGRGFGGPGMFGMALPPQKTKDMGKTLRQLLVRMPDLVVDLDGVVEYPNWAVIGGWAKIPATFTPGSRVLDAGRGPGGEG